MAAIYVSWDSGNDSTGTGAEGSRYKTLEKALSVATTGDQIILAGSTSQQIVTNALSYSFADARVQVLSETGDRDSVVLVGSSAVATESIRIGNLTNVIFDRVTFRSAGTPGATNTSCMRFTGGGTGQRYVDCQWQVLSFDASTFPTAISEGSGHNTSRVEFVNPFIRQIGPTSCKGFNIQNTGGFTMDDWRIINADISVMHDGCAIQGVTNLKIHGGNYVSWGRPEPGQPIRIGVDGSVGATTTGTVSGASFRAMTGHASVFGAGTVDLDVIDCTFIGGSNSSGGQGLVVKNSTRTTLIGNTVHGGYNSTFYLKGVCDGCVVEDNKMYNSYATAAALRIDEDNNDNTRRPINNIIRNNVLRANIGKALDIAGTYLGAGNIIDQNTFKVSGAGTLGTVRGTTVATLAELRAAWATYDQPYNDSGSALGDQALRYFGNRRVALA